MLSPRTVAGIHATYYVVTGAWSVAHRASFERVSGPKRDYSLVRLVGGLGADPLDVQVEPCQPFDDPDDEQGERDPPPGPSRTSAPSSAAAATNGVASTGPHIAQCLKAPAQW